MRRFSLWVPSLALMLVSLISYIDRNTLALLAPTILRETGLTAEEYGWIISAFSVAYMISNPVWGRLLDRFGLRAGMTASVSFWTLSSAAHALASGFWSFAAARASLGFGEGATFPGGLRAATQTLPPQLRSRGIALSYSGGSLGAIITPILVTPIAAYWGWRGAFVFTGLVGCAWLAMWSVVSRRGDIRQPPRAASRRAGRPSPGWSDGAIWSYMILYAFGAIPLAFVLYVASIYLNRVLGKTQIQIGEVLWIPPLGWEIGYFVWGWITDRTLKQASPIRTYRLLLGACMALSLPLAAIPLIPSYPAVMAELFFAMFVAAGFIIVTISYATWVYSGDHAGLIAGLGAGAWGATVALIMPWFGRLFDQQRYGAAFVAASVFPLAGYIIWAALNRRDLSKA